MWISRGVSAGGDATGLSEDRVVKRRDGGGEWWYGEEGSSYSRNVTRNAPLSLFFFLYRFLRGFSSSPSCAPRHYWSQMTSRHARVTWHTTKMADRVPAKLHLLFYFLLSFASLSLFLPVFSFSLLPEKSKHFSPGRCYQDSLTRHDFDVPRIVEFFMAAWFPCASIFAFISLAHIFSLSLSLSLFLCRSLALSGPFLFYCIILLLFAFFFSSFLVRNSSIIRSLHNQLLINLLSHLISFFSLRKLREIL